MCVTIFLQQFFFLLFFLFRFCRNIVAYATINHIIVFLKGIWQASHPEKSTIWKLPREFLFDNFFINKIEIFGQKAPIQKSKVKSCNSILKNLETNYFFENSESSQYHRRILVIFIVVILLSNSLYYFILSLT